MEATAKGRNEPVEENNDAEVTPQTVDPNAPEKDGTDVGGMTDPAKSGGVAPGKSTGSGYDEDSRL